MKRSVPQNGSHGVHATPEARALHAEIAAAQRALTQARGRALEARNGDERTAVLTLLRRASIHVDEAIRKCVALKRMPD
jgi:hypothetical protein